MAQMVHGQEFTPSGGGFASRVCWGAIFAGVVVGLVTHALLTLLGLAIGLTAIDPITPNFMGIGIGSGIWLVLSMLIATFTGAWVTSLLANISLRIDGVMHGIVTWGLLLFTMLFLTVMGFGRMVGGTMTLAAETMQITPEGVAAIQEQVDPGVTQQQIQQQVQQIDREQAAQTATTIAWWSFAAALLSLGAGALGGLAGLRSQHKTPHPRV